MFLCAHRILIARSVLALMLFAQAAIAWSACDWLARAPERVVRAAAEHAGCESLGTSASSAAPVCLAHCLSDKQAPNKPAPEAPWMPAAVALVVMLPVDTVSDRDFARESKQVIGTGPPRRILLQSFQI